MRGNRNPTAAVQPFETTASRAEVRDPDHSRLVAPSFHRQGLVGLLWSSKIRTRACVITALSESLSWIMCEHMCSGQWELNRAQQYPKEST